MNRREWCWVAGVTLALVFASSLPYLIAWAVTPQDAHFTGILFNPQDGASYLAKMREGFNGSWLFRLPYTPEPHRGAPVYLFYLLLGHVARWTGWPLILIYHAARALGGAAMLTALYALAAHLSDEVGKRRAMFLFAAVGSGLGWLAGLLGLTTADLWVPEAFPIYALLANAHFPLAMGLMAGIACCGMRIANGEWRTPISDQRPVTSDRQLALGDKQLTIGARRSWSWGTGLVVLAVALGAVQPFGLIAVCGALGAMLVALIARERRVPWRAMAWLAGTIVAALPYPLYVQWALNRDRVLATWNTQNVTPSPPLWDWALSYGLVLVLAAFGGFLAARRRSAGDWLLLGWTVVTVVGMYLPLPLQRRLSLGLGMPLGLLAGIGWWRLRTRLKPRRRELAQVLALALCTLTPIFVTLLTLLAALAGEPRFYLSGDEWAVLTWLRDQGRPDAVVLCLPRMGLFVPAWAGQPVVYGHPFETVNAQERRSQVEAFFAGEMSPDDQTTFLQENRVRYGIGDLESRDWRLVFESGDSRVYEIEPQ